MTSKATKTGSELERRVADAYRQMGARKVEHDVELAGNQIDVYVELETPGCLLHRIAVEAKDRTRPVGIKIVNEFARVVDLLRRTRVIDEGIVVSASGFSRQARNAAKEHGVRLLEPADLEAMTSPARVAEQTRPPAPTDSPPPTPSISEARPESPRVCDATPTDVPRKPGRTEDLDVQTPACEAYASYEVGLRRLLTHLGQEHPRYLDALAYQQRLNENIELTQSYGDTDMRKAERSEVISRLNALALFTLRISFNELCKHDLPPPPPPDVPATVLVPAGPFWMGSLPEDPEAHENEKPRRKCELQDYWIGRYPVTNAQYACFLKANPQYPVPHTDEENARPYNWDLQARTYPEGRADHPVVLANWEDAGAYCRWLSQITGKHYRLPTEEEWEKAARGDFPDTRRYPWGDKWRPDYCNTQERDRGGTTSVHEFEQTNCSPFGVVDMAGNVWEWTASQYGGYPDSLYRSVQYGRLCLVVRGGSWHNSCRGARVSCRGRTQLDTRRPHMGFRIVSD